MSMNSDIHSNNSHSSNSYSSNHSSNNNLEGSPDHLVVLVHGVGGTACELKYIAKQLSKHKSLLLKAPEVNHGLTQDGIPQGANRIYHWILDIISSHSIKYLSFIGHSLGGIYARTVIGLLHKNHLFPNYIIPVNFITIATPHLGARQHAHLGSHITGRFLKTFFGDTLLQLTLTDSLTSPDQSFLLKLTDPFYITPLKLFTNLICYANVRYDSVVCYTTGNIRLSCITDDVLDKNQVSYPAVVEDKNDEHIQDVDLINDSLERKIHRVLNRLPWKRYAVFPSRPLIAHTGILNQSDIVRYYCTFGILGFKTWRASGSTSCG
ncbi:putative serine esterase-domain-containing protein [Globomyces pollinis-pini]|nr:putative serine esterase-domain-containing protein [Globomyces pollinis-pini]